MNTSLGTWILIIYRIVLSKFRRTIPATRKIIMTGYATLENAVEAVNNGAGFFLMKPVKLDTLLGVVNKQLQERAMEIAAVPAEAGRVQGKTP